MSSRFNVDIMMLCFSAMDHARKLKFSSYVHLLSIKNVSISLRLSDSLQCRRLLFLRMGAIFQLWSLYNQSGRSISQLWNIIGR